jgi:hypothetical protein
MKRFLSILCAAVVFSVLIAPPIAGARASDQIASYSIGVTAQGNGNIRVSASIAGTHPRMTRIGFPSIALFERANSSSAWTRVHSSGPHYNPNATAGSHSYTFTYRGVAGRQYYAQTTFFAQDALGSDSRSANSPTVTAT